MRKDAGCETKVDGWLGYLCGVGLGWDGVKACLCGRFRWVRVDASGVELPYPNRWIDNFAMRNFTNNAVFDDTLPVTMEDRFRRKGI
jgi:hypothetical protein